MHNKAKQMFEKRYVLILTDMCFCIFILFCHIRELNLLRALSWMAGALDWIGNASCLQFMVWNAAFCESTTLLCSGLFLFFNLLLVDAAAAACGHAAACFFRYIAWRCSTTVTLHYNLEKSLLQEALSSSTLYKQIYRNKQYIENAWLEFGWVLVPIHRMQHYIP